MMRWALVRGAVLKRRPPLLWLIRLVLNMGDSKEFYFLSASIYFNLKPYLNCTQEHYNPCAGCNVHKTRGRVAPHMSPTKSLSPCPGKGEGTSAPPLEGVIALPAIAPRPLFVQASLCLGTVRLQPGGHVGSLAWEAPFRGMRATEYPPPPTSCFVKVGADLDADPREGLGKDVGLPGARVAGQGCSEGAAALPALVRS